LEIHVSQREILKEGAQEFGIELSPRQLDKFDAFTRLLLLWNQKFNITRITDPEEISVRHYLDSLAPLAFITPAKGAAIMDIGTGGGMPGIPLKIARPDIKLSLLDSTRKRLLFVEEAARDMELSEVKAIHSRAEDAGQNRLFRERFDFTVSRAVARLPLLAELCLPFCKVGGTFIAYKGPDIEEELDQAKRAIKLLGGEVGAVHKFLLPHGGPERTLVFVKKMAKTSAPYPRKAGIPERSPL